MSASQSGAIKFKCLKVEGRVHPLTEILKIAGIPFDCEQIPVDKFIKMKGELPYRNLPLMTLEDGRVFSEMPALLQYVGLRAELLPSEPTNMIKAVEICTALHRLQRIVNKSIEAFASDDKETCQQMRKSLVNDIAPQYFKTIEKDLKAGKSCGTCGDICKCGAVCKCGPTCQHRYLVGNKLSIADIMLKCIVDEYRAGKLEMVDSNIFKKTVPDLDQHWYNNIQQEMNNLLGTTK